MKNRSNLFCLILTAMLVFCATNADAKPKQTTIYVFGISISLTDSTAYLTDIQTLETAYIDNKTGFLYDRSIYSQQLQMWIEYSKNKPGTTCAIFFGEKKSKVEKKYIKVRNKYNKDRSTKLHSLETGEFKFIPQDWSEHESL